MSTLLIHFYEMLNQIAIVASVVSAITAVSTSLRALGKSRELRWQNRESPRTRVSPPSGMERPQGKNILLHLIVTIIWIALSIMCLLPLWLKEGLPESDISLLPWISAYTVLILILCVIWIQVFRQRH